MYNLPKSMQDYPIDLQRSHLYPRDPEKAKQAMQDRLDGKPTPTYLPQKMAFQRWKTPPYKLAWLSGTVAMLRAKQNANEQLAIMRDIGRGTAPPSEPITEAANRYQRMPQPMDYVNPNIQQPVLAQGAAPAGSRMSSDDITRLGHDYEQRIAQLGSIKSDQVMSALQEIQSQSAQHEDWVSAPAVNEPEFLRRMR